MNKRAFRFVFAFELLLGLFLFAGCGSTMPQGIQQNRAEAAARIQAEPPGDYFIGRRYFKGSVSNSGATSANRDNPGTPRNWLCSTKRKSWRPIGNG